MPDGLIRFHQAQSLHFLTWSCYHRLPFLTSPQSKRTVEQVLEQTRARHGARIYAYVLMPEHVHLLINERFDLPLDQFIKAVKQETSRLLRGDREHFWQKRYYDANIHTDEGDSFYETLRYIHRNPVKRGLAASPEQHRSKTAKSGTPRRPDQVPSNEDFTAPPAHSKALTSNPTPKSNPLKTLDQNRGGTPPELRMYSHKHNG